MHYSFDECLGDTDRKSVRELLGTAVDLFVARATAMLRFEREIQPPSGAQKHVRGHEQKEREARSLAGRVTKLGAVIAAVEQVK